jgi:hypothetical protein
MKTFSRLLKRVILFEYEYREAKNLEEIAERLKKTYRILPPSNPTKDALIMRSLAEKGSPKIIFLLLERDEKGGEVIILETIHSWYTSEKILSSMRAYCKNAGIKCRPITPYTIGTGN